MTFYLTKEKKKELEKELKELTSNGRKEIAERLDIAKALGDLKENAEYHQAREDQGKMESRVEELEIILKDSEIIKPKKNGEIQVGSKIDILNNGKKQSLEIVGRQEVDIVLRKIAVDSPLAKELMGKKEGDKIDFITPNDQKHIIQIKKVS